MNMTLGDSPFNVVHFAGKHFVSASTLSADGSDISLDDLSRASTASLASLDSVAQITLFFSMVKQCGLNLELEDFNELASCSQIFDSLSEKSSDG
jgi:hypothetical protein